MTRGTAVLAGGALALLAPVVAAAQAVNEPDAIRAQVEAYRAVWNTHDASALAAFFTADADFVMGNSAALRGRQAIRDSWAEYFSNQEPERTLMIAVSSIRTLTADVALVDVVTTTGGQDARGRALPARRARGTWVLRHEGNTWLIAAMQGLPTEEDRVVLTPSFEASEALRPQIRAFISAYEDAWSSKDPEAVSALFGDDADLIVRNQPRARGRRAIREYWEAYFSEPRPYRVLLIIRDIRMLAPDVALLTVTGTGAPEAPTGEVASVRYSRAVWVLRRESGDWRVAALRVLPAETDEIVRRIDR